MKDSTELRYVIVGSVFVGAFAILLFGMFYLNDKDPRIKMEPYRIYFDQVSTLTIGDPVKVNGVKVGKVENVTLLERLVQVDVQVRKGIRIATDSEIKIQNIGLLGERQIGILQGKSPETFHPNDSLSGSCDAGISEAMASAGEVFDSSKVLLKTLRGIMDSTIAAEDFQKTFKEILYKTNDLTKRVDTLLLKTDPVLKSSLANLKNASVKVNALLDENRQPLKKIVEDASQITTEAKEIVAVVDEVIQRLNGLTEQLASKENTVGALINDTAFYGELRSTVRTADSLLLSIMDDGLDVNIDLF